MSKQEHNPPYPDEIQHAASRIAGQVTRTPIHCSSTLDKLTGNTVFLKCENFQKTGSFKFRGATDAISLINPEQRLRGVVTHSSGSHAQALALAANMAGVSATVVMPFDAPDMKAAATRSYGAEIVECAAVDREKVADELVKTRKLSLVHP